MTAPELLRSTEADCTPHSPAFGSAAVLCWPLLLQLERKRYKRRLAIRRLQEEHEQLLLESKAMDLLVQHQDTVARSAMGGDLSTCRVETAMMQCCCCV
jgi:hypothetical protein